MYLQIQERSKKVERKVQEWFKKGPRMVQECWNAGKYLNAPSLKLSTTYLRYMFLEVTVGLECLATIFTIERSNVFMGMQNMFF